MVSITATPASSTSMNITFADIPGGSDHVEMQYCCRPDFRWALAPIFGMPNAGTGLEGFNQASTYYMRARPVDGAGARGLWGPTQAVFLPLGTVRDISVPIVLIQPAAIVPPEPILEWVVSSELAGYPVRALGRDDPTSVWQALQGGGQAVFITRMSGAPIDTFALLETNAPENATLTFQAGPSRENVEGGAPAFSYGPVPFRASQNLPSRRGYHALVMLPAPVAQPFWRVVINGTTPAGIFAATYAVFGLNRYTKNISAGRTATVTDGGTLARGRNGTPSRTTGTRGRNVDMDVALINVGDFNAAYADLGQRVGTTDPVLVVPNSKSGPFLHDEILYGALTQIKDVTPYTAKRTLTVTVDSLI